MARYAPTYLLQMADFWLKRPFIGLLNLYQWRILGNSSTVRCQFQMRQVFITN